MALDAKQQFTLKQDEERNSHERLMVTSERLYLRRMYETVAATVVAVVLTFVVGMVLVAKVSNGQSATVIVESSPVHEAGTEVVEMVARVQALPDMAEDEYLDFNGDVQHVDQVCD